MDGICHAHLIPSIYYSDCAGSRCVFVCGGGTSNRYAADKCGVDIRWVNVCL